MKTYLVGGAVRDRFLGIKSKDVDFAVEASSYEEMRNEILKQGAKIYLERPEFGSLRANHPVYGAADFTLCRKDGFYSDNRHPDSIEPGTLYDDLSRRDFTVNAMAVDKTLGKYGNPIGTNYGQLIDYFGGESDLLNRTLRCVGSAEERLMEDPLRALRAIRFMVTKGLVPDRSLDKVLKTSRDVWSGLMDLPADRIREELDNMFRNSSTYIVLKRISMYHEIELVIFSKVALRPTLAQDYLNGDSI